MNLPQTPYLPASAIKAVRMTCKKCGASISIPLGAKDAPNKCFNCYTDLPGPELVQGLVRELSWLKSSVDSAELSFDAAIEGEPCSQ